MGGVFLLALFVPDRDASRPAHVRRDALPSTSVPRSLPLRPSASRLACSRFSVPINVPAGHPRLLALATGVRFLPLTAFVFFVPLATRRVAVRVPLRIMISAGLVWVARPALMHGRRPIGLGGTARRLRHREASVRNRNPHLRLVLFAWWVRRERGWPLVSAALSVSRAWPVGVAALGALLRTRSRTPCRQRPATTRTPSVPR